ncbi:MAG: ribosome small subunit-dependent GTPase A [Lachnospiraceae bacterium]|nr:ribosome small subunit-dependent GTPase A [Lachnospiraceae bacterium]
MRGKIIKGIGGFYYVYTDGHGIYECKAKGVFRNQNIKPMVGDNVMIDILDEEQRLGNMTDILERNNALVRPAVANIDQAMMIFAMAQPAPNLNLLDRFLLLMNRQQVNTVICFNKTDLAAAGDMDRLRSIYEHCGCQVEFISVHRQEGVERIRALLSGKTTVFAGPSGVGKSSLLNALKPEANVQTGAVSEKIKRGKHTTRHSEIIPIAGDTYVMDTPGFTSLYIDDLEKETLWEYFHEFRQYEPMCRFASCSHIQEPDCGVKQAVLDGKIHQARYDSYVVLYGELENKRRRR